MTLEDTVSDVLADLAQFGDERLPPRFWERAMPEPNSGCWLWLGAASLPSGHGKFYGDNKHVPLQAHRFAYESVFGKADADLVLDHYICDTPSCVNPHHVRPATHRENTLRGNGPAAVNARKTHCVHGHLLSGANVRVTKIGRYCRTCDRERRLQSRTRKGLPLRSSTHCKRGHEFTPENTAFNKQGRYCRRCHYDRNEACRQRKRQGDS